MPKNRGLLKMIILIIIGLVALGYFGFDLAEIIKKPGVQNNLTYVWDFIVKIYNSYLKTAFVFIWNEIFVDIFWEMILRPILGKIKNF